MFSKMRFYNFIFACVILQHQVLGLEYNPAYDPFKTLASEAQFLNQFIDVFLLDNAEQKMLPKRDAVLVGKLVTDTVNFTTRFLNKSTEEYKNLSSGVAQGITNIFGNLSDASSSIEHTILQITEFGSLGIPLIFFCITSSVDGPFDMANFANSTIDLLPEEYFGNLHIRNGSLTVYRPVQSQTVFEFVIQLYVEPFRFGMSNQDSLPYLNMTDQMLHLIGTRFENTFGDSYYRVVIQGFYPTRKTLIVRTSVLLDPSDDNYYYAHRTWFDLKGFVMLGKYPILPDNVYLSEIDWVPDEFYKFLSNRSYKYPMDSQAANDYMMNITLPVALVMVISAALLIIFLRVCNRFAFTGQDEDEEGFLQRDIKPGK